VNKRTFEYDAFGPWIYRIEGKHTLPRLFESYRERLEPALMIIKIPRNIERAAANPDMHLYDVVAGLFQSEILLLERTGDRVAETVIAYDRIESMKIRTCLLSGKLTLFTDKKTAEISYNIVSDEIMREMMNLIRDLKSLSCQFDGMSPLPFNLESMELGFVNLVGSFIKDHPDACLIAYQPNLRFNIPREIHNRIIALLPLRKRIQSSFVVLTNTRELMIVHRIFFTNSRSTDTFAYNYYFYPFESIQSIETEKDVRGLKILKIVTNQKTDCFKFEEGNNRILELQKNLMKVKLQHPVK